MLVDEDHQEPEQQATKRVVAPALEEILYNRIDVLDHGFIRVVDYMGNDGAVVQAARVSYGRGTKKLNEDKGLINYLVKHLHTTPLEMCELKLHVKLPIFVARQWIRHRTANVNEYSARYSVLDKEFYLPDPANICPQSKTNRQGRGPKRFSAEEEAHVLALLREDAERCYQTYGSLLKGFPRETQDSEEPPVGLARELARIGLTLNYYTQWYWKIDLHNLLHFVALRASSHAQYEIRAYATVLLDIVKLWVPLVYEAFMEHMVKGARFSSSQLKVLKSVADLGKTSLQESGLSVREWNELDQLLKQ